MIPRRTRLFALLVAAQAAHSVEEYLGRFWENFPPAAFLTGLVASDRETGFLVLTIGLIAFGAWTLFWPVRRDWNVARRLVGFWVVIELINGVVHPLWSLMQGGYTPGLATAPLLLVLALLVGRTN